MATLSLDELLTFFRGAGMTITPEGDQWQVLFVLPTDPTKRMDTLTTEAELRELYEAIETSYNESLHRRLLHQLRQG